MTDPDARPGPGGTRFSDVRWVAEVTSTNDEVAALARSGAADGVVVVADHQTAGRGRRGRIWESPPGASLLTSVLVRPVQALLSLAAGLAVVDAVADVAGVEMWLKWPNDVVDADGRKLAGILTEVQRDAAVVGLGLNLDWQPPLPDGACSLASLAGRSFERSDVLEAWLAALARRLDQGDGPLLEHYRASCCTLGRRVRVEMPRDTIEGTAADVDDTGRLVVDHHKIEAGDVVHLR